MNTRPVSSLGYQTPADVLAAMMAKQPDEEDMVNHAGWRSYRVRQHCTQAQQQRSPAARTARAGVQRAQYVNTTNFLQVGGSDALR